ncbi:DUF3566 domain-containing protein [Rhodococcus artemisiae]|uniref:DUF3566 domain-containing protein n=1 Tax=Rhodococcus artemisiae TaxID=714159 RepID=A0ABU7L8P2_9NOCA|nr:DUF3566 domain-containing protein [Rhodococcus artemisiae]MEE2057917.1 DUF3566 domain-containing protein [Rhodococcus artemisiae]
MSTPQGPNGSDQGKSARKPEDRNGREVETDPSGPAAEKKAPEQEKPSGDATKPDVAQPVKPAGKPAADSKNQPAQSAAESTESASNPSKGDPAEGQATRPVQRSNPTARPSGQTPPWQRGQQQPAGDKQGAAQQSTPQQNTPQTNLPGVGPGLGKAANRPSGAAQRPATGPQPAAGKPAAKSSSAPTRPVVTGTAAASMTGGAQGSDRAAAKSKSAVIDGPTRHIERKDLAKDLPDLSTVKHPTPAASVAVETPHASPVAVAPTAGAALRATVQLRRIDPWSMLKVSALISLSLFFVWMIAVGLLYGVLAGMGVWDRLNSAFTDLVSESGSDGLITVGQVFGYATVIGLANMVLMTALATLGAFIYNLCSDLVGGVQVTLADPD